MSIARGIRVDVFQVEGDELASSGARQVRQPDHCRVANADRTVVGPALSQEGRQFGALDVAPGGKAAAGGGPQIDGPHVVVGLQTRAGTWPQSVDRARFHLLAGLA